MGFKGVHIAWTCFPDDKIGKNNEICCENYDVDDDGGDGGCNHNGDDNNGLVQMHKLFSSKM